MGGCGGRGKQTAEEEDLLHVPQRPWQMSSLFPRLTCIHTPLHSQVHFNGVGPRNQRLPQVAGTAPGGSVKVQRREPHSTVSLWYKTPGVSPQGRLAVPHSPPDHRLPFAHLGHRTHPLAAASLSPFCPIRPRWGCLGLGRNPSSGLENHSGTGALARRFGRGPGQGVEERHQNSLVPGNSTPLPAPQARG